MKINEAIKRLKTHEVDDEMIMNEIAPLLSTTALKNMAKNLINMMKKHIWRLVKMLQMKNKITLDKEDTL